MTSQIFREKQPRRSRSDRITEAALWAASHKPNHSKLTKPVLLCMFSTYFTQQSFHKIPLRELIINDWCFSNQILQTLFTSLKQK